MAKIEFSLPLAASYDKLIKLATDYESLSNYLPDQLKSVKIIEQNNDETITEERLMFASIFKKEIEQKTSHKLISDTKLSSHIISGPAKGTTVFITYEKINNGTKVTVEIDLKLGLKYKILRPVIKKWYKFVLTGILNRMNTLALKTP